MNNLDNEIPVREQSNDDDGDEISDHSDVERDDENNIIVRRVRRFTAADRSHLPVSNTVDQGPQDEDEDLKRDIHLSIFDRSACICLNRCFGHLSDDDVDQNIMNVREMTKDEKEMFKMGVFISKVDFDKTFL